MQQPSLRDLWNSVTPSLSVFNPDNCKQPDAVQRYVRHAIAPGTVLASAVHLRMHGEIKLSSWLSFEAEQVIAYQHGMIWSAVVRMYGLPIRGYDSLLGGKGSMRWKLLGLLPLMSAAGPDITRSTAGRLAAEYVWLPSILCSDDVQWTTPDHRHIAGRVRVCNETPELMLAIADNGAVDSIVMQRWGNPDKQAFAYHSFGGVVLEEATFAGYTIPVHLRIGWYAGTDTFVRGGEFFRVHVTDAVFR